MLRPKRATKAIERFGATDGGDRERDDADDDDAPEDSRDDADQDGEAPRARVRAAPRKKAESSAPAASLCGACIEERAGVTSAPSLTLTFLLTTRLLIRRPREQTKVRAHIVRNTAGCVRGGLSDALVKACVARSCEAGALGARLPRRRPAARAPRNPCVMLQLKRTNVPVENVLTSPNPRLPCRQRLCALCYSRLYKSRRRGRTPRGEFSPSRARESALDKSRVS